MAKLTDTIILGDLIVTGTTRFKNDVMLESEINSNFIPDIDGSYSLGTASLRFSIIYSKGIDVEGQITSIDTDSLNVFTLGNSTNASAVQIQANANAYELNVNGSLAYTIDSLGDHYFEETNLYLRKAGLDLMSVIAYDDGGTGALILAKNNADWSDSVRVYASSIQLYSNGTVASWNGSEFIVSGSTVWHTGNDGAGSGLDADLLDGLHASSFVRGDDVNNGLVNIVVNDADFNVRDTTDAVTNFIYRDHSAQLLYLGSDYAAVRFRGPIPLDASGGTLG